MAEDKLACLFRTNDNLEICVFSSVIHSGGTINAFVKYEGKKLEEKIPFKESVKSVTMIANDFVRACPEINRENEFRHFGDSSDCKYSLLKEDELKKAFEEYFLNYKDSLS